jgi:hypothetical protein
MRSKEPGGRPPGASLQRGSSGRRGCSDRAASGGELFNIDRPCPLKTKQGASSHQPDLTFSVITTLATAFTRNDIEFSWRFGGAGDYFGGWGFSAISAPLWLKSLAEHLLSLLEAGVISCELLVWIVRFKGYWRQVVAKFLHSEVKIARRLRRDSGVCFLGQRLVSARHRDFLSAVPKK